MLNKNRYLRECPLKAIVGKDKIVYHIHPGVLAACGSPVFGAHISGSWKDTGEGTIDWTDFDSETIDCVLNYLYTGDYGLHNLAAESTSCSEEEITRDSSVLQGETNMTVWPETLLIF